MNLLQQNSVTFPRQQRVNDQGAWPFFYPLIPYPYHDTDVLNNGTGLLGIKIPAGTTRNVFITLEQDTAFRLINFKYTPFEAKVPQNLSGTITTAIGSPNIVGVGTTFVTDLSIGDYITWLDDGGVRRFGEILTITDNLNIVLTANALSVTTGLTYKKTDYLGFITTIAGSAAVVGTGTTFTTDLSVGSGIVWTDDNGQVEIGTVFSITDNTNLTLEQPAEIVATQSSYDHTTYTWYSDVLGIPALPNTHKYIPLTKRVRVGVNFPSLDGRYMYGGIQSYFNGGFAERPRLIASLQGLQDGAGMIRSASLLPHEGSINIKVTNEHTQPIYINGTAFGYKVTLSGE